ncbi:Aste57867_22983 [Aphanomyces stellatus]|uniref:Aste57867_22983 protein n=1 Tax=Aphanomyces stellatus TaxID=120398 RepID=A0A485LM76_9STRA|nr:hypothetical protein As57867_022912 [Aphanomyces stellatus]VFT99632.1 Aste57867_22983 [Aphanomyces stellatus]
MRALVSSILGLAVIAGVSPAVAGATDSPPEDSTHRIVQPHRCFPDDFMLGTATASYQVEGAWNLTGRTPSIWDDFCRERDDVQCANVADDMFHRYPSDIQLMKEMGLSTFRFSISWSRVMTWNDATQRMVRNDAGIAFYHQLLDAVRAAQLKAIVTLYHWDLPSSLHTRQGGWLNASIASHFDSYASLMFDEFGAKVNYWSTFNEPWSFCQSGYGYGSHAPGVTGSTTASYLCAHNVLRSHATAVQTFRTKGLHSKIGIVLNCDHPFPLDPSSAADVEAAERKMQFFLGWFLNPIVHGDYPAVMKSRAGDHLPSFTPAESALLRGSYDLFMLNHYSSNVVTDCASSTSVTACGDLPLGWARDMGVDGSRFPAGARPGDVNAHGQPLCGWFNGYPTGYLPVIRWMHAFNTSAPILLTENGWCGSHIVDNQDQLWYYQSYLEQVWHGIQEGLPIIGYTAWSLVDNYEWGSFEPRFGLFHVDFPSDTGSKDGYLPLPSDLKRTPRPAATWLKSLAHAMCFPAQGDHPVQSNWVKGALYIGFLGPMFIAAMAFAALIYRKHRRAQQATNEKTPLVSKGE